MIRHIGTAAFFLATLVLSFGALEARAEDAVDLVKKGMRLFNQGDYEGAGSAFAEADVALPDNLRIAFDRACVYTGQGDMDKAIPLFQSAAMSRETDLAVAARYNLGRVDAAKAMALFGEQPENAPPATREEGLRLLVNAVGHFRDVLELNPDHEDARHNLELIRLWIKHMEALWKEKDRQKNREEMNLLQFLEMIEQRQLALRLMAKALDREDDSPRRRQALDELEQEQRALAEEIEPLKEKIEGTLAGPTAQPAGGPAGGQGAADPEKIKQALSVMKGWADEVREAMLQAADSIPGTPGEAATAQKNAVETLDRIYGAAAPYSDMLKKAIETQQALVDGTIPIVETPEEAGDVDFEELVWPEERVAGWSEIIGYKAQEGLKNLPSIDTGAAGGQAPPGADPEAMKKQVEGLKKSMEKAVKLCPEVKRLTGEAADDLRGEDAPSALPKEEEALKLLKEIAEDLPKQDQQQGDQEQQQDQQDQQQQDSKGQQEQPRSQRDLSREEAEALLQKAKEREREHRDMRERLMRGTAQPGKVEKDW